MPRTVTRAKTKVVRKTTVSERGRGVASRAAVQKPSYEQTAQKAFELFAQRGYQHGRDWDDWFQAERMLSGKN